MAIIQETPSRLVLPGIPAEPQRKDPQAQLLHQHALPGRRSLICEYKLHTASCSEAWKKQACFSEMQDVEYNSAEIQRTEAEPPVLSVRADL